MAAVKSAELRVRLKVLTWQELAALLPAGLQEFLDVKYGIVAPGMTSPSSIDGARPLRLILEYLNACRSALHKAQNLPVAAPRPPSRPQNRRTRDR